MKQYKRLAFLKLVMPEYAENVWGMKGPDMLGFDKVQQVYLAFPINQKPVDKTNPDDKEPNEMWDDIMTRAVEMGFTFGDVIQLTTEWMMGLAEAVSRSLDHQAKTGEWVTPDVRMPYEYTLADDYYWGGLVEKDKEIKQKRREITLFGVNLPKPPHMWKFAIEYPTDIKRLGSGLKPSELPPSWWTLVFETDIPANFAALYKTFFNEDAPVATVRMSALDQGKAVPEAWMVEQEGVVWSEPVMKIRGMEIIESGRCHDNHMAALKWANELMMGHMANIMGKLQMKQSEIDAAKKEMEKPKEHTQEVAGNDETVKSE